MVNLPNSRAANSTLHVAMLSAPLDEQVTWMLVCTIDLSGLRDAIQEVYAMRPRGSVQKRAPAVTISDCFAVGQ